MQEAADLELNQQTYEWCVRIFDRVKHLLSLRIKMHHEQGQVDVGDIFLFNHFARMETFIPQYLIYQESGAFCRSVAAAQFFEGNESFAKLLVDLGAVPNDHPRLLPMMAANILRERKIIVFPEGGMVKDRRVLDDSGDFNVYSRKARERRKHHTGAARLAIGLQIFKQAVLDRDRRGNRTTLQQWADLLGIASVYELVEAARKPVTIVPANITFYPLRVSENMLVKGAELFTSNLSDRAAEELIVEGNLMLKATDMDIRLGDVIQPKEDWRWWEKNLVRYLALRLRDPEDVFDISRKANAVDKRYCALGLRSSISRLRDDYMQEMYLSVTVNLSHVAAHVILSSLERGRTCLGEDLFRKSLYLAIKRLQRHRSIHLHRGLCDPGLYAGLLTETTEPLAQLLRSSTNAELIEIRDHTICFLDKLSEEHEFDEIRIENPIEVYANEVRPLGTVIDELGTAVDEAGSLSSRGLAMLRFDDECVALEWDRYLYNKPRHEEINQHETATTDPEPFFLLPAEPRRIGVVLVHGFLATPAEVREFGDKLHEHGYNVIGVRLKGHGTSPWDLRDRNWEDWVQSIRTGYALMREYVDEICIVGFSTGGALSLVLSAEDLQGLRGTVSICTPMKYQNRNMWFVPLMHGANKIVRWLSSYEGIVPFRPNQSEHPHINYRNMPVRGLYELTRLEDTLSEVLPQISCPVTLIQATEDRVVDPQSANMIFDKLGSEDKRLHWVESKRHGILNEDIGDTQQHVFDFLTRLESEAFTQADRQPEPLSTADQPAPG